MSGNIYDKLLAFVNGNTGALCNIYKDEYLANGPGLLFIMSWMIMAAVKLKLVL